MKTPPTYAITSVDHALRIATMLQLEGALTVAEAADRLGVARSTAHRILQMLVYRDFAVQDETRTYHAGPVLHLAQHSRSLTAQLRAVALPHLERLVDVLGESVNLSVRTGAEVRFIASVESHQALRVTSREGMVFPAHVTSGGLVLLAEQSDDELISIYSAYGDASRRPDLDRLRMDLRPIRRQGFAVNQGSSETGMVAVGVPVRAADGTALACVSVAMPSVRYDRQRLPMLVASLRQCADAVELALNQ